MADLIVQQMLPMARFRYPNTWKMTAVAGSSPQANQVIATGVASKHNVIGKLIISNNGDAKATVAFNWEDGSVFLKFTVPVEGVTLENFIGIEPTSETADKDLHADVTSDDTIAVDISCGYFEVSA